MRGHVQTLLEAIATSQKRLLHDLPILTPTEGHELLVECNRTEADYPRDWCIHELFEAQVEQTPNAVAVVFEDQHLTYRELNNRSNRVAHYLRKLGVGPGVLVGLSLDQSLERIVGLFGVLKAGGAYVPIDPAYPATRLAFMLNDANTPVVLTQQNLMATLPPLQATKVICLDSPEWASAGEHTVKPRRTGTSPD